MKRETDVFVMIAFFYFFYYVSNISTTSQRLNNRAKVVMFCRFFFVADTFIWFGLM